MAFRCFRRGAVDQQLDQAQCHVDPARDAGGRDEPLVQVLDHTLRRGYGAVHGKLVVARPVCRGGQVFQQSGGAEHE